MRPKVRYTGLIGSYGWGTQITNVITQLTGNLKAERLDPVLVKGLPREEDLQQLDQLARSLGEKIMALPDLAR